MSAMGNNTHPPTLVAVPTPLPNGDPDQREAAFIKLLAEAIASDIKRGGAATREPLDESDEAISATISCEVAVARKTGEADDGLLSHGHPHESATTPLRSPGSRSPSTAITTFNRKEEL
jgi:hypothetical protein